MVRSNNAFRLGSNEEINSEHHESKPIRTLFSSLIGGVAGFIPNAVGMMQLPQTGIEYTFRKLFTKDPNPLVTSLQNNIGFNLSGKIQDSIDRGFGTNPVGQRDRLENAFGLVGDLIPLIGTGFQYGLIKGASGATRALTRGLVKAASKAPNKFLHKTARNAIYGASKYALPGVQIDKKLPLSQQKLSIGMQTALPLAQTEAIGAYTDTPGIIGNYAPDEPSMEDLDSVLRKQEQSSLLPSGLAALTLIGGHFGIKYLNKMKKNTDTINKLSNVVENAERERTLLNKDLWVNNNPLNQTDRPITVDAYNKYEFVNDPRYRNNYTDQDKANLTRDYQSSINAGFNYGMSQFPGWIPRRVLKNMQDLHKYHPEKWKMIEDLIEVNNKLSNYYNAINKKIKGKGKYKDYLGSDELAGYVDVEEVSKKIEELQHQSKKLLSDIRKDKLSSKILDDIEVDSKNKLKLSKLTGNLTQDMYDYLIRNNTVNGVFTYKPFIEQLPDEKSSAARIAKWFFEKAPGKHNTLLGRTDRDLDKTGMSFTDTYAAATYNALQNYQINSQYKSLLLANQTNQLKNLKKVDNDLINAYNEKAHIAETNGDLTSVNKKIKRLETKMKNLTLVEYVGYRDPLTTNNFTSTNNYSILNRTTTDNFDKQLVHPYSWKQGRQPEDLTKLINEGRNNPNVMSFFDENGREHMFIVDSLTKKATDLSPNIPTSFQQFMLCMKRIKQETTTGKFNPLFATSSLVYGVFESLTSLPRIFEDGLSFKKVLDHIKYEGQAIKMQVSRDFAQNTVDNWWKEWIKNEGDLSNTKIGKNYPTIEKLQELMKSKIEDCLLTKMEMAGATTYHYPNGINSREYPIDINMAESTMTKLKDKLESIHGVQKGLECFKFLTFCTDALRNASNLALFIQKNAEKNFESLPEMRLFATKVSRFVTDSKKSGLGVSKVGALFKWIGDYLPYGRVMTNSVNAKLEAAGVRTGVNFTKTVLDDIKTYIDPKTYENLDPTKISSMKSKLRTDILNDLKLGLDGVTANKYLQMAYYTVFIPATVCYLWNNLTQDRKEEYYALSDYNKASKLLLVNFYGKGRHLSLPMDQEFGVLAQIYLAGLDGLLNLSADNGIDPAFEQSRLIGIALSRSLGLENMVVPEAMLNIAGYQSNLGVGDGKGLITKLPINYKNLDGSETAYKDGLMDQETLALVSTLFGSIGAQVTNGIEQYHTSSRDGGLVNGIASGIQGSTLKTPHIPLVPDSKLATQGMNQTGREVKYKIETIDKLRKLLNYSPNTVGQGQSLMNNPAMSKDIDPKLQFAAMIAQDAVPYFNQKIQPMYQKIKGYYKQMALYNATGRDAEGNVVTAYDRFNYMQKQNKNIQYMFKYVYNEFDNLEKLLTMKYKHDINLSDFSSLQGG